MSTLTPHVSVIIPFRNESDTIEQSIMSIVKQDYSGSVEIVAINDSSKDLSVDIIKRLMRLHNCIKLIESTGSGEIEARNAGISVSTGKVIVNFSAHAVAAGNFLTVLVSRLMESNLDVVGVGCKHLADGSQEWSLPFGEAIRSAFGGYGTTYYQQNVERFVVSVAYTAYRAELFSDVGSFDPAMVRSGDAEFNLRLGKAGYKLLYTPATVVYHYEVTSPSVFFVKMVGVGVGRVKVIRKHHWSFRPIYAAPSVLVLALVLLTVGSFIYKESLYTLIGLGLIYLFCSIITTVKTTRRARLTKPTHAMLAFPLIHIGYGLGFIKETIWPS